MLDLECFASFPAFPTSVVVESGRAATTPDFTVTDSQFIIDGNLLTPRTMTHRALLSSFSPIPQQELTIYAYVGGKFSDTDGLPYPAERHFDCAFYAGPVTLPPAHCDDHSDDTGITAPPAPP